MKNKIYLLITTIALVAMANNFCWSQTYILGYNPDFPNDKLGNGVLVNDPFLGKDSPFSPFSVDSSNFSTHGTTFTYRVVSDETSVQRSMGIDGYLSVSSLNYDVESSIHMNTSSFYNASTITLAISAYADCGSLSILGTPQYDSTANSYINSGNISGFEFLYGDNFIYRMNMGVNATLFLTLSNLTQSEQSSLSLSLGGSGGVGTTVSAGVSFNSSIQRANSTHNLKVSFTTMANLDFNGLDSLIFAIVSGSQNPVNDIQNAFAVALTQKFDCSKAVPTKYFYKPYLFNTTPLQTCKIQKLTDLYNMYYSVKRKITLLQNITASPYYTDFHNNADANEAIRLLAQYNSAKDSISAAYDLAKADTTCNTYVPAFTFNDALINKFLHPPFVYCISANQNFEYSYVTPGKFVFTSTADHDYLVSSDFYYCASTDQSLAGKQVNVRVSGIVYNPDQGGWCGTNHSYQYFLDLKIGTFNGDSITEFISGAVQGNSAFQASATNIIGNDGNFAIELLFTHIDLWASSCTKDLVLKAGAQIEISIVNPSPAINAIITPSDATICQGDSITLTANTCASCSYLWSTGETTQSISVKQPDNYTVKVSDSTGNSSTSYWSTIKVKQPPVVSNLQPGILSTPLVTGATYQWYLNGVLIVGATGRFYSYSAGGSYSVEITYDSGCSSFSTDTYVGISELQQAQQIKIYPNPANSYITIETTLEKAEITVTDLTGKVVLQLKIVNPKTKMDCLTWSAGIYFISVKSPKGHSTQKFIKE